MATWAPTSPCRTLLNSAAIFGGEAFSRLATFVMAVIIARQFGPVALGQYGYALALASILLLVPDFGLHLLTTRDLAADPERLRRTFWSLHWIKFLLAGGVAAFTLMFGQWALRDGGRRLLLYVLVARALLQTFSLAYMAIFKAFERMHYIALQQAVNAALVIAWVGMALRLRANLAAVVAALLFGQGAETWLGWRIIFRRFAPGKIYGWDRKLLGQMLLAASPIGITAILQALNLRLDILILGIFAPDNEVGRFQAAQWFLVGAFLFASLLMSVLFPRLSRLMRVPSARGSAYIDSLLKHAIVLIALVSLGVGLAAQSVLRWLFGTALTSAADLLRILAVTLPFMFINTVLFFVFVAARRRLAYSGTLAMGVVLGAALSFRLAPRYGATGSALADLIREFAVTAVFVYFLKREALAETAGSAFLKVSLVAAGLALVVAAFTGPRETWVGWAAAWNVFMLAGALIFVGLPNPKELLLLASEGS